MDELTYSDPPHSSTVGPQPQVRSSSLVRPSHADNATKPAAQRPKIIAQKEPNNGSKDELVYIVSTVCKRDSRLNSGVPFQRVWPEIEDRKPTEVDTELRSKWDESKAAEVDWEEHNASVLKNLALLREETARRREEVARCREVAGENEAARTSWLSRFFPCLFPVW